jgi:hypothetical protein
LWCKYTGMETLQITAYLVFLSTTGSVTLGVGWLCYRHGIHYLRQELQDETLAGSVNRLLLLGYYLVNIGYCFLQLHQWRPIQSWLQWIESLSKHIGMILFLLGFLHVINLIVIYLLRKRKFPSPKKI